MAGTTGMTRMTGMDEMMMIIEKTSFNWDDQEDLNDQDDQDNKAD